ncbi:MAG: PASTA domain-containing protein [Desulfobacteraceae bacterium]|nr:PASTA domain-containing protein [Desulfobacteraceae bacterium]
MRRRKHPKGKLAAAVLVLAAIAALLVVLPARMPEPAKRDSTVSVPAGAVAGRKNIYDRRLRELAVSLRLTSVYARPLELRDPEMIAGQLATILGRDEKELLNTLRSERGFVWLGRRLDAAKTERIAALKAKGLYFVDEEQRYYPNHETAAHVLGFLSNDQGLAGIEFQYERILQGGWGQDGRVAPGAQAIAVKGENGGANLVLTLDLDLQKLLEGELAAMRQETGAAAAMALVMDPGSGEIRALVNLPAFDPNRFWEYSAEERRNRVLVDGVHPGGLWNLFRAGGGKQQAPAVPAGEESPPGPQQQETAPKPVPLNPDWAALGNGLYASPALAALGPAPEAEELGRLRRRLEAAGADRIDLPQESGATQQGQPAAAPDSQGAGTLSALQLLTGFNRAVSSEASGPPHLLKALWPAGGKLQAVSYQRRPPAGSSTRKRVLQGLQQGGEQPGLMAESLVDLAVPPPAAAPGAAAEACRRQDVLLGISQGEKPFTFLLVLEGACIDPGKPSLLRHAARRLLQWLAAPQAEEAAVPPAPRQETLVGQGHQVHAPAAPVGMPELMPEVRGQSLRQALQELQSYSIPVAIQGSGRVTGQEPQAGTPLKGVKRIRLELKAN